MSTNRKLYWAAACLVLASGHADANLLSNFSFESGAFVNDGNQTMILPVGSTTITGWTVVADQLAWINAGNPYGLSAQEGNYFLDLTAYPAGAPFGGISQTIATTPGQQYELSFYLGSYTQRWGGPPVSIQASAGNNTQTFTVSTPSTASTWTPFSMSFTALSANTAVSLRGTAGVQYIGLDNIDVEQVGSTASPEPGTYGLLIAGLTLVIAKRRMA